MAQFTHLHLHTQYSVLDGACELKALKKRLEDTGMTAVAVTDHGNMYGIKEFHEIFYQSNIKPILGCEVYVAAESRFRKHKEKDRKSFHLILLAKNRVGYHNLVKLVSYGYTEGFYRKPRIDFDLLKEHAEGLIVTSACIGGEIPRAILNNDFEEAERVVQRYKEVFGDDFYLEMQRHISKKNPEDEIVYKNERQRDTYEKQEIVNLKIKELSDKYNVKYIATNDVHFLNEEDADAHEILLALSTGKTISDPNRMRYTREEYLKTPEQMAVLFHDFPEALSNTQEIVDKVEQYSLSNDPIMPEFKLPEGFEDENDYLRHLTYEMAAERWDEINEEKRERLDFELATIKRMGYPGYFLIVWDFLVAARRMGIWVGPGRGSAAGSAVSYCLKITNIDPFKHGLLFERFLNPDRISMPDIDIDFDDDGREEILQWVENKYGKEKVAGIVTFGTMKPKNAVRDVARVLEYPLEEANRLSKLIPDKVNTLAEAFKEEKELDELQKNGDEKTREVLSFAQKLEGSVRQTGVHACGIIIGRNNLEEYIPVSLAKSSKDKSGQIVTQFEGKFVEDVGLLKMDFLGLKTLSIVKQTLKNIKRSKGIDIDIEKIPFNDKKTFALFARGETGGLFQFESDGMQKNLKELKPDCLDDLIAMNALYRPGPMKYIPNFIARKHGLEEIKYDLPEMEEHLKATFGITVYQEQVMLLSQKLANFTKGDADGLRKAMGKKIEKKMAELKVKFLAGCEANGHPLEKVEKIWSDWERFAKYAFNKSHSTGYSYLAYQAGYLKANYPAEYMAASLSRNLSESKKIASLMAEAGRLNVDVLKPDINKSRKNFVVDEESNVLFGLGGIKSVGNSAVESIVSERDTNGPYKDFFDFIERVNLSAVNKKTIEALVYAGGFDNFGWKRSQYFAKNKAGENEPNFIEECIRYGNNFQKGDAGIQASIFDTEEIELKKPEIPQVEEWNKFDRLNHEKELIGIYLSEHPLDAYSLEIETHCNTELTDLANLKDLSGKLLTFVGIVESFYEGKTKKGKDYGSLVIADRRTQHKIMLFGKDYVNFKKYFIKDLELLITANAGPSWKGDGVELKISKIELLSEARENMIKSLNISILSKDVNKEIITELKEIIGQHKGKQTLSFQITEPAKNIHLQMFSRSLHVGINKKLVKKLQQIPELQVDIN